jgi:flagellar hook-length control protein FliK
MDNTAKANSPVAASGDGGSGSFTDSLDSVLAQPGAPATKTSPKNDNDAQARLHGHGKKLKSKLKNGEVGIVLTPQQLQQQQAIIQKLGAANTGIDIPALRAAMGKGGHVPGKMQVLPTLDPVTGKVTVAQAVNPSAPATPETFDAAVNAAVGTTVTGTVNVVTQNSVHGTPKRGGPAVKETAQPADAANTATAATAVSVANADPSKAAAHAASQDKLVTALLKTATAPVLKAGQADGSKVPNAKIGHHAHSQKADSGKNTLNTETVQSMAVKIAATAGATNSPDTAPAAAKGVAVAEVASRTAPAVPTVTKIETAAMANATQTATHTPTAQAKIEAQALPVQFDTKPSDSKDGNADSKSGSDDKSHARPGSTRNAAGAPKPANAPAPNFPGAQPSTPASSHTDTTSTNANLATAANTQAATPATIPPQIATTLQVSQQPPQNMPADQTTFAALGVFIAAKSKDGEKQFDINMHPADLGRVDVRISVDADGKTQAHLSAEHPQTLQMLQNDKITLERSLREAGLNVANNGLSFSLKGEQQSSTPTFNARSRALSISAIQTADISSISSHASLAPGDSRLDIRV